MGDMKSKRRLLIAGVIAAVAVLAIPALALATVWRDHGTEVTKSFELTLNGGEIFETTAGNGMSCEVHATLTSEGKATGKITKFEIKKCPTGFGTFAKCEFSKGEAKGLPWTVDLNATDLTITKMRLVHIQKAGCATLEVDKTIENMTVTLQPSTTEISELLYDGKILSGEEQLYRSFGTLTIEGTNNGTYGIG